MQILKLMFKRETFMPVAALAFASAICFALVVARVAWTGNLRYSFLVWNLFLAWLPLMFAILAEDNFDEGKRPGWRFFGMSAAWLLFFPNAPYIFTDLVHLTNRFFAHFWIDLAIVLSCALTGLILGFVSLYLMQSIVTRMLGRIAGWAFVAAAAGLCSFGIYLGRFLRFNSWDVIAKPGRLASSISSVATGDTAQPQHLAFLALFATFLFIAYVMLYALTHLPALTRWSVESDNAKPMEGYDPTTTHQHQPGSTGNRNGALAAVGSPVLFEAVNFVFPTHRRFSQGSGTRSPPPSTVD